jgi:hypothetical protein
MMKDKVLDLIAKYEFWYATKFIQLDKHYTFFVDLNGPPGSFAIKFLRKYDGVIVEFTNVKVSGDSGQLTFDYDVISNVNNCNVKSKSFVRFTSNVMRNILHGAIENAVKGDDENRNIDPIELDSERSIYEEESTVPQKRVPNRKPRKKTVRRNKAVHS